MLTRARRRLIGRRLLQVVPVVVLATFMVFGLLKLVQWIFKMFGVSGPTA